MGKDIARDAHYEITMGNDTLYKRLYLVEPLWKLDGSKCHLFHLLIIHTLLHGMFQPITAAMLESFKICIKGVGQITHINPCKQEIVP